MADNKENTKAASKPEVVSVAATPEATAAPAETTRRRGRKPGSKNKPKTVAAVTAKAKKVTPKTAPKPADAPKAKRGRKPKSAPKPDVTPKPAGRAAASMPNDWAQMIVNQIIEAQRMWLDMTTQQTALVFKTVTEVMGMSQNAPTEALANWAKQGVEGFIEAQKHWSEIAMQQSGKLIETVQSGASLGGGLDALGAAQGAAGKGLETLVYMRTAWLDFASQQNSQMMKALKQNLNVDESSPVSAIADFAQQTVSSYVEIQKRWLDLATQMPFFGITPKDKK